MGNKISLLWICGINSARCTSQNAPSSLEISLDQLSSPYSGCTAVNSQLCFGHKSPKSPALGPQELRSPSTGQRGAPGCWDQGEKKQAGATSHPGRCSPGHLWDLLWAFSAGGCQVLGLDLRGLAMSSMDVGPPP